MDWPASVQPDLLASPELTQSQNALRFMMFLKNNNRRCRNLDHPTERQRKRGRTVRQRR